MLQTMRNNAQGIIAKIIVFFIIVVFALWGVESIVNLGGGEEPVAVVDGNEVQEVEVLRLIEQRKSSLRRQFGDQFDESLFSDDMLRRDAVEQLIEQKVASSVADRFGVFASSEQVDEAIVSIPAFQQDGRFDKEQFLSLLRLNGWSPMGFRQSMEDDLKVV
ncbi:MAG: SurA N-terminal domain-containing protein, partial [Oceanobacter sp.]